MKIKKNLKRLFLKDLFLNYSIIHKSYQNYMLSVYGSEENIINNKIFQPTIE